MRSTGTASRPTVGGLPVALRELVKRVVAIFPVIAGLDPPISLTRNEMRGSSPRMTVCRALIMPRSS